MSRNIARNSCLFFVTFICFVLVGCSTQNPNNPSDPYETYNRHAFNFNRGIDKAVLKPTATFYSRLFPWPVREGIGNAFSNINEIPSIANDLLQGNFRYAANDVWRFAVNTTIGILGLFDVASKMGLEKHPQDFGLTLAKWGYRNSNYLVLPIFGPNTVRDAVSIPVNFAMSPFRYFIKVNRRTRIQLRLLALLNRRADLLSVDKVVQQASFDPYAFERDAYLQYRNHIIQQEIEEENLTGQNEPKELHTSGSAGGALTQ